MNLEDRRAGGSVLFPPRGARAVLDPFARRVVCVIADTLYRIEEEIELQDSLRADLHVDSLDYVELVLALERAFDVSISDAEALQLDSVQSVIDYLRSRALPFASRAA